MERPQSGRILLDDLDITAPGVDIDKVRTRVGMVFQHFNLYAHLDVLANVSLALRLVRGMKKDEAEAIARAKRRPVG